LTLRAEIKMFEIFALAIAVVGVIALVGWWHGPEIPR